jgi:hypothetical protein
MRLTEDEKTTFSKFRNVSDLRVQYKCEYRFYLQEKHGQKATRASIEGAKLHDALATSESEPRERHQLVPIAVAIVTIIIGYLWIFG